MNCINHSDRPATTTAVYDMRPLGGEVGPQPVCSGCAGAAKRTQAEYRKGDYEPCKDGRLKYRGRRYRNYAKAY